MKNSQKGFAPLLVAILIIVVMSTGIILYKFTKPKTVTHNSNYNFEYRGGFKFWEKTIDIKPNVVFETLVSQKLIESCISDRKNPKSLPEEINSECKKAPGMVAILTLSQNKYETRPHQVFAMPSNMGFFGRNLRDLNTYPKTFYDPKTLTSEVFFILPFDEYFVPSYYSVPKNFLSSWKKDFLSKQGMNNDDFTKKIRVVGVSFGGNNQYRIHAYYINDWVQLPFSDDLSIDWKDSVISKEKLIETLNNYKYPISSIDVNRFRVENDGHIYLDVAGDINKQNNECVRGRIDLMTGKLVTSRAACVIY